MGEYPIIMLNATEHAGIYLHVQRAEYVRIPNEGHFTNFLAVMETGI